MRKTKIKDKMSCMKIFVLKMLLIASVSSMKKVEGLKLPEDCCTVTKSD